MYRNVGKYTLGLVHQAKIKISLRFRAESQSLSAFWIAKDTMFVHADNEDLPDCLDVQADLRPRWAHCKYLKTFKSYYLSQFF